MKKEKMKEFNPLVSIIIPIYNGSNYMREAIDSAIGQTYKNIEIIVVNDGSNDKGKTKKIALSYGNKVKYFEKENGGVATALNLAIKNANGKYISWLSHDDVYYPDKIKIQIDLLTTLEDRNTIIYSGYNIIDENSKFIGSVDLLKEHSLEDLHKSLYPLLNGLIHGCSLLIPKACFDKIGLFNEKLETTQDYDLWFKFLRQYPICFSRKILIKSRIHAEQTGKLANYSDEQNKLWINFINSVTKEEVVTLNGSWYAFYSKMERFLFRSGYKEAYRYICKIKNDYIETTKDNIIIPILEQIELRLKATEKEFFPYSFGNRFYLFSCIPLIKVVNQFNNFYIQLSIFPKIILFRKKSKLNKIKYYLLGILIFKIQKL
ncbi:glycosyltransferase [Pseudomonadota bacterium]